jgi:TfoX/Sxy family transcriptional regulator of competence genes
MHLNSDPTANIEAKATRSGQVRSDATSAVRVGKAFIARGDTENMAKTPARAGADRVALYEALLATHPDIERKGAALPYTSVNGNMFSILTADGTLALRLPTPEREAFLKRYKTTLSTQYGAVMKEYVRVPATLLPKTRELAKYLGLSYRYARSLRPKPTTKSKTAGRR